LSEIDNTGIPYYFLYTLNAYGKEMEPGFPGLERRVDDFIQLSEKIGSDKTIWRYDPIIITTKFDTRWHLNKIEKIAVVLKGRAEKVIISFYTPYRKTAGRMAKYCGITIRNKNEIWNSHTAEFVKEMKNILSASGFRVQSCAETLPLREYGIMPGACIDGELINKISGDDISARKDRGQRPECLCVKSIDIGRYNTCLGGCRYCYAV
jgi:DNA repair photolyase